CLLMGKRIVISSDRHALARTRHPNRVQNGPRPLKTRYLAFRPNLAKAAFTQNRFFNSLGLL
ncbi:hypothetical protein, partial [Sphingomonas aerolata]|uniref:hypothetical protein n=1 Tax=Sphingomonas aerolata TaxID=185951 RepID=UPI00335C134A